MEDLIDAVEIEMKKRVTDENFEEKLEEIDRKIIALHAINRVAIWKWEASDISFKGEVLPSENPVNTLIHSCLWDS